MPKDKSTKKACISFAIASLFMLMSLFGIISFFTSPAYFTTIFTISLVSALTGLAFWNGPQDYVYKMFQPDNKVKSFVLIGSIIGALVSALFLGSFILSLIFCVIEFNAVLLYFCNSFPIGRAANTGMADLQSQAAAAVVSSQVKNFLK